MGILKGHMQKSFFQNGLNKEDKSKFNDLTNIVKLNEALGFDKVHIGAGADIRNLFDGDQMEKINLYLMMKNKEYLIPETILKKALYKQDNVMTFDYEKPEDLTNARIAAQESPEYIMQKLKEEKLAAEKRALINTYGNVKDVDFDNKTYLAIDFEFNPMAFDKFHIRQITEIGLSYIRGKDIITEHYVVNEHRENKSEAKKQLQDSFNFGVTTFINSSDVMGILENALMKSENLVFHEQSCDVRYFEHNKLSLKNHRVYDTQEVYRQNLVPDGQEVTGKKLKTFLADNMIIAKNTHNAGNDAHYTAMLFKVQVKDILANERKKTYAAKIK